MVGDGIMVGMGYVDNDDAGFAGRVRPSGSGNLADVLQLAKVA